MAKDSHQSAAGVRSLRPNLGELALYNALATNESAVCKLSDETFKELAVVLTQSKRRSVTIDRARRETVHAVLRIKVKNMLRYY